MAVVNGTSGDDELVGTEDGDTFEGFEGNDTITGLGGNDQAFFNVTTDGADTVDLGDSFDGVFVSADAPGQVRLTFTSAEVGNGNPNDGNTMMNQDGGLAVRLQAENGSDGLTGPISRYDDEFIFFVSTTPGLTFDVRDLVSGAQRGDQFDVVTLGSMGADTFFAPEPLRIYVNTGMGDDTATTGSANDFLVGGAGADTLEGAGGNDSYIGGTGADAISDTGGGDDRAIFNVTTDGSDNVNLGDGSDVVAVNAAAPTNVRLTFTSAEVGNGNPNDSNTMMNQDGGLAVRLQAEDGMDMLTGPVSRYDDEGITFVGGTGVTFDVRDLVSGVQRGDQFEVVVLGTMAADTLDALQTLRPYYFNGGMGNDVITGGNVNDFLVGGAGNDGMNGVQGNDTYIGGGGDDQIIDAGVGNDRAIFNVSTDGADNVNLSDGTDVVTVNANAAGQVRLTFTSAEVGNGDAFDLGTMMNQDGGLAVRLQAEDGSDGLTGPVSRYDDEGMFFVGGAGVTFDVRDLVSGVQRGDAFEIVALGTMGIDALTAIAPNRPYYFNAGMGDDSITGGTANDFLVGGAGNDMLEGAEGNDSHIGGGGRDRFMFSLGAETGQDTIIDFMKIDLVVTDALLRDGNGDGIISFGPNGVLDLDRSGDDTVTFGGMAPATALRLLGQLPDGDFAYADAATRPMGAIEGMLGDSMLTGGPGEQVFFFDTALELGFGDDRITGFGAEDLLVTTSAINDSNGDGRIAFGADRTLNLSDGTSVVINDQAVRALEFDGTVMQNGVTYYVYSSVGSTQTGADDLFG